MQAVINVAIAPLTTNPALWAQNPQQSRLVDELLLGMPVEITGEAEQHMVPVRTFYGYTGWVAQDALLAGQGGRMAGSAADGGHSPLG